ncbi:MAG: HDIG domain-containing protein [Clostridia bacterium]|nr:HDIG domain-containing protein [Clostridia bacterium]
MNTVTKLTQKDAFKSIFTFLLGIIGVYVIMLCMIAVTRGVSGFSAYFIEYKNQLVTIGVSIPILFAILYTFFFFENKYVLTRISKILELFLIIYIALAVTFVFSKYVDPMSRPFVFVSLMCVTLFRRRDAIFINTTFALMMLIIDRFAGLTMEADMVYRSYACLLCAFCTGIIAAFVFSTIKNRFQCVIFAFILFLPVEIINCVIVLPVSQFPARLVADLLIFGAVGCLASVMLYMFILPIFEKLFAEMTVFRLREITSDSVKLIKKLKESAPGTYSHSVVVSQLVEACAKAIGEDPELARAAAFYHDVGKLKGPEMFAENQTEYNFHDDITPELSVDIIRSHTRNGAELIKKSRLPEFFADVAVQHHGTMPIKYFYYKALKMSDGELNIDNYSYAGPIPESKIAALIMIADSAEASTRTLPDRSPEKVEAFVRGIIEERLDLGQFDNCNITMRDLTIIKNTIVSQLSGVYHSRVVYPKISISKKK